MEKRLVKQSPQKVAIQQKPWTSGSGMAQRLQMGLKPAVSPLKPINLPCTEKNCMPSKRNPPKIARGEDGHFVKVYFNSDPASGAASYSGLRPDVE